VRQTYEAPKVFDHGSIAENTFARCGGRGINGGGKTPPKDFPWVPHHIDKFGECSSTGPSIGLSP
jgi:hypothetical protein